MVEPGTKTLFQLDGVPALELYQEETGVHLERYPLCHAAPVHLDAALGEDTCIIQTMSVDRNGVMFNGKAIYENDSIYIMDVDDYRQIHEELLASIQASPVSFLLALTVRTVCAYLQRTMP